MRLRALCAALVLALVMSVAGSPLAAQESPIPSGSKIKNYLPHMTRPEVQDLLTRTDMVVIPVGSLEQHGLHLPIGTDFLSGIERAQLIAQRTDVLVAPIMFLGQSPYHMEFEGTITLSSETIQRVYVEAVESLIRHGFKRFLFINAHGGNRATTGFIVDRINQETAGIAVDLGAASGPFMQRGGGSGAPSGPPQLDRHGGTSETSRALYLFPELVDLDAAVAAEVNMPEHLEAILPDVLAGDPTALLVFLAEGLKDQRTGKGTSAAEMSSTGVWGTRDPAEGTAARGRDETERSVAAAVAFIERWKELRPLGS